MLITVDFIIAFLRTVIDFRAHTVNMFGLRRSNLSTMEIEARFTVSASIANFMPASMPVPYSI